jgi:hypothetical protein
MVHIINCIAQKWETLTFKKKRETPTLLVTTRNFMMLWAIGTQDVFKLKQRYNPSKNLLSMHSHMQCDTEIKIQYEIVLKISQRTEEATKASEKDTSHISCSCWLRQTGRCQPHEFVQCTA